MIVNSNPMVDGDIPLVDIVCTYNYKKVLYFITT